MSNQEGEIFHRIKRFCRESALSVLTWIYPPSCSLCGTSDIENFAFACETCWSRFKRTSDLSTSNLWIVRERTGGLAISKFFAFLQFDESVQKIIHEFKYNGRHSIAVEIIRHLSEDLKRVLAPIDVDLIVPIPLHQTRIRDRGYNQSDLIASEISKLTSLPVDNTIVKRVRSTQSQTLLSASERLKNVAGAFEAHPDCSLSGKSILLVDDLITTGSTFNACARVLLQGEAKQIYALAIARA